MFKSYRPQLSASRDWQSVNLPGQHVKHTVNAAWPVVFSVEAVRHNRDAHQRGEHMATRRVTRAELLEQLNARFSEAEIRQTARIVNALPADAEFGAIPVALGIIPRGSLADWRRVTGRVPVMIAVALAQGVRGYMAAISRTRGARYAGVKAIRISIVDGERFGLVISQEITGMRIELIWGRAPVPEQPGQRGRRAGGRAQAGAAA